MELAESVVSVKAVPAGPVKAVLQFVVLLSRYLPAWRCECRSEGIVAYFILVLTVAARSGIMIS
jgi:hypothetical protein